MSKDTDEQLVNYSQQHLLYELQMLGWTAKNLPQDEGFLLSAVLESFVVHLRNLIDFFYIKPSNDTVGASYFFEPPSKWVPGDMPQELDTAKCRANKELSHITYARKLARDPAKVWKVAVLFRKVTDIALRFVEEASSKKLHPKVVEWVTSTGNARDHLLLSEASTRTTSS